MNRLKYLVLAATAAICFTVAAPKTQAQISVGVNIGAALHAPTAIMTTPRMLVLPTVTTAPNGFRVARSLALARGFMAPTISVAT